MSLSTFLLKKHRTERGSVIDGDLDTLFRSSVRLLQTLVLLLVNNLQVVSTLPTSLTATPVPQNAGVKRRRDTGNVSLPLPASIKQKKSARPIDQSLLTSNTAAAQPVAKDSKKIKKKRRVDESSKVKGKTKDSSEGSDEEQVDDGLEEAYERKIRRPATEGAPRTSKNKEESESASDSDVDGSTSQLVHETVAMGGQQGKTRPTRRRIHYERPPDETKEQRDARTIFIGNIPVEVAKSKVCTSFLFLALTYTGLIYTGSLL